MSRLVRSVSLPSLALVVGCSGGPVGGAAATVREDIIGGVTDSGASAHPAAVFLLIGGGGACTGSLIAPNLVLTARHCVSQNLGMGIGCDIYGNSSNGDHVAGTYAASDIGVYTGVNPQPWTSPDAVGAQIFTTPGKNLCNNDIALVVLDRAVAGVTPMKIRLDWGPAIGEVGTAVGYGATSDGSSGSAGTRRRRINVPVLGVGQDWNKLTGANEFAAGQSVCSGDSGGPFVSSGDAVMGIASRVSNCSDPSAPALYTRVDSHKALILQAFTAAGASPNLESGSPPPPPTRRPTGEGPCRTGSECAQSLCLTSRDYCSDFCSTGACPTGMVCTETTFTLAGQSVTEKICTTLAGGSSCSDCRNTDCVNVITTCVNNPACSTILACVDACPDAACSQACVDATPAGFDDYDLVRYCACNSSCADECAHQCEPPSGAGGADGGGEGGAANAGSAGEAGASAAGVGASAGDSGVGGAGISGNFGQGGDAATAGASQGTGAAPVEFADDPGGCGCETPLRKPSSAWLALPLVTLARRRARPRRAS